MATESQTTCTHEQDPRFLERVGSLPIVTTAIDQLAQIYQYTKGTNAYVKYTLETAEAGVKSVTQTALPVVNKLEKPIGAIDSIACNQLDKLEQKFPIVTRPTEEVVEETKKIYESTVKPHVDTVTDMTQSAVGKVGAAKQYTVDSVAAVKDYGVNKVSDVKTYTYDKAAATATYGKEKLDQVLETQAGQAVISRVDQALDTTEQYVDYYLPGEKMEGEEPMDTEKESDESSVAGSGKPSEQTFGKLVNVSDKVRSRMYAKSLRELQHVKKRSQETIERLNFTVDLIEYAKTNLDSAKTKASSTKDKFLDIWEQINLEEDENLEAEDMEDDETMKSQDSQSNLERRAILAARHLTSQLKRGFNTMMSTVTVLPSSLQKRITDAKQFSETLYTNFANAKTLEDVPSTLVSQTRTHVANLQGTILSYTEYLRNSYFGSWLGAKAVKEMEVEEKQSSEEEEEKMEEELLSTNGEAVTDDQE